MTSKEMLTQRMGPNGRTKMVTDSVTTALELTETIALLNTGPRSRIILAVTMTGTDGEMNSNLLI